MFKGQAQVSTEVFRSDTIQVNLVEERDKSGKTLPKG
jgi:hypothetical protein